VVTGLPVSSCLDFLAKFPGFVVSWQLARHRSL
jgi:hypothetical protein